MSPAVTFCVMTAAMSAGHWCADYWVQRHGQAMGKGAPGWAGRRACAAHVTTYTLTLAGCIALASWTLAVPAVPARVAAGLAVSAVSHYVADRRRPLARLAAACGKGGYWDNGGAAPLDQAWHWSWLFVSALVIAGRWGV